MGGCKTDRDRGTLRFYRKATETISFASWLKKVRHDIELRADSHTAPEDGELELFLQVNPAVKLLGFYEEMLGTQGAPANKLEIEGTERTSAKLRALEGIKAEWIYNWIRERVASME